MDNGSVRTIIHQSGYRRERLPGGIFVLRLQNADPETIDAWYEDCLRLMSRWETGQRLRYLHDIRGAEVVTPHTTDRVARILRRMREIPVSDGRGAILLNNQTIGSLLQGFFKRRPRANWEIRFFNEEERALRWLQQ